MAVWVRGTSWFLMHSSLCWRRKKKKSVLSPCCLPPVFHSSFHRRASQNIISEVVYSKVSNARQSHKSHPHKFWIFHHYAYTCPALQSTERYTQLCLTKISWLIQTFKWDMSWDINFLEEEETRGSNWEDCSYPFPYGPLVHSVWSRSSKSSAAAWFCPLANSYDCWILTVRWLNVRSSH